MRWFRLIHKPTLLCCCTALFLSIYPGKLSLVTGNFIFLAVAWVYLHPMGVLLGLVALVLGWVMVRRNLGPHYFRPKQQSATTKRKRLMAALGMVAATGSLIALNIPLWLGFMISRPFFNHYLNRLETRSTTELTDVEQQLANWRSSAHMGHVSLKQQLGVYPIRHIGIDKEGGSYFVVETDSWFSTDTYYGIAHRPQSLTPFGQQNYHSRRILGDWYEFKVTEEKPWL